MRSFGNLPRVHVEKEPRHRTHHENMKRSQEISTTEKEDNADSTATTTTAAATLVFRSEWEYNVTEGLAETTTPDEQICVFGERRWVKPARKWRTPSLQERKEKAA